MIVVALDGGGSSCTAVAADEHGQVFFRHTSGPVNASAADPAYCTAQLAAATAGAPDQPDVVAACWAGVSDRAAAAHIRAALAARFTAAEIRLAPDHVAALLAHPAAGVCVIAGTGSAVTSLVDGRARVTGGHGPLIGDHGSAFSYGQAVVDRVLTDPDGSPALAAAVMETIGTVDRAGVISAVHAAPAPAALIGQLAPALTALAGAGDPWALDVVARETSRLAEVVGAHVRRWPPEPAVVSLAGSVWQAGVVVDAFRRAVALEVDGTPVDPVAGAVRLALLSPEATGVILGWPTGP